MKNFGSSNSTMALSSFLGFAKHLLLYNQGTQDIRYGISG
jgi:hypothetical protein